MLIERDSGVALWRQIADSIRQSIAAGDHDETGMMPGEMALAVRYGVNRHTVRAAIAALVEEGLLEAVQGKGTMVRRQQRYTFPISRRTRFSEGLSDQARDIQTRLVSSCRQSAPEEVAAALGLAHEAECIRLDILASADGKPVSTSVNYFPASRFADMAQAFVRTGSVTLAFRQLGIEDYFRASTDVAARLADESERNLLNLSPGAVVLETVSVNVDPAGNKVQYARTAFAADRVNLRVLGSEA